MYLGIEIGGTKLQLVAGDDQCRIVERRRLSVTPAAGASGIRKQIEVTLPDLIRLFQPEAIGVGFGGPVDWQAGRICRSHQIEGWSEFDLAGWLSGLSGLPIRIDNDANVGALGEALLGAGVGANPVFYVTLGSGVGGGLVVNGTIYHGASPGEAEIGHVRLDRNGTIVEQRCSGWAVDRRIRELCSANTATLLAQLVAGQRGCEARFLSSAIAGGDQVAAGLLRDIASDLAFALSHAVHLFHPEMIILGGGLSKVGEPLRAAVEDALSGFCMDAFAPGPRIRLAGLGEDAVPAGALKLATAAGVRKTP